MGDERGHMSAAEPGLMAAVAASARALHGRGGRAICMYEVLNDREVADELERLGMAGTRLGSDLVADTLLDLCVDRPGCPAVLRRLPYGGFELAPRATDPASG